MESHRSPSPVVLTKRTNRTEEEERGEVEVKSLSTTFLPRLSNAEDPKSSKELQDEMETP
jgi:hypothetical protein